MKTLHSEFLSVIKSIESAEQSRPKKPSTISFKSSSEEFLEYARVLGKYEQELAEFVEIHGEMRSMKIKEIAKFEDLVISIFSEDYGFT